MQVACPNPACGAIYTVGPQHFGKAFACKNCGASVTVNPPGSPTPTSFGAAPGSPISPGPSAASVAAQHGVAATDAGPQAPAGPSATSQAFSSAAATGKVLQQRLMAQVKQDVFAWVLGAGVIILAICMFFPMLDNAKAGRRQAKVSAGDAEQRRANDDLARRERNAAQNKGTALSAEEKENRRKANEAWEDTKREMEADVEDIRASGGMWRYWYTWGAFAGTILVTVASIAFAAGGNTTTRRVTGAVLIVLLAITFLGAMMGKGPAVTIAP